MQIIADLQIHSRFSRAVSPQMTLPNIAQWARKKGIELVATGDWMHPMWFREIERDLEEAGNGLLKLRAEVVRKNLDVSPVSLGESRTISPSLNTSSQSEAAQNFSDSPRSVNGPLFLLATEVSSIFTQNGKGRRVHTLIWVPTIDSARKISQEMTKRGCNLMSDGRPIIPLSCIQTAELVFSIDQKALIIPAHCLLPESQILGENFVSSRIDQLKVGDSVLTHIGEIRQITEIKTRQFEGNVYHVQPWYFRPGLRTTPEHPFYAIKTLKKCPSTGDICRPSQAHLKLCRKKTCLSYKPDWIQASKLEIGDMLVYPRSQRQKFTNYILLDPVLKENELSSAGGSRGRIVPNRIPLTKEFGRLVGYYLAEGSTDSVNSFSFCFSNTEQTYIDDVITLVASVFGVNHYRMYTRNGSNGVEINFYSKIHARWFSQSCYLDKTKEKRAFTKALPSKLLSAELSIQAEVLRGWFRGDHGYTTSQTLMNQMKALCLMIGIIPSIIIDTKEHHDFRGNHMLKGRKIQAFHDVYALTNFAFFEDQFGLKNEFPRSQTKIDRRHGWIDEKNVYLPIKNISLKRYQGVVYNLEVNEHHSYVAEFAAVHNCWTPWFSTFGSMSGFNSIEEAYGQYAQHIYAIETGLSSNPSMNWQIRELDNRSIVSFSDAHSGPKLGREATVFDIPEGTLRYDAICSAIKSNSNAEVANENLDPSSVATSSNSSITTLRASEAGQNFIGSPHSQIPSIAYTIEFYPEEGKYHFTGHRACNIRYSPQETKEKGTACPVCGRPLTQGVMQRVEELAGRTEESLGLAIQGSQLVENGPKIQMTSSKTFPDRPPFVMLVPLQEIIAEAIGSPVSSTKTQVIYEKLTNQFGSEFTVLFGISKEKIAEFSNVQVADGVEKVRSGDILIDPGYDGVFGVVKIWKSEEEKALIDKSKEQLGLF